MWQTPPGLITVTWCQVQKQRVVLSSLSPNTPPLHCWVSVQSRMFVFFFFLLQHKVGSVGSAFSSAYRLRGADISHCLGLCTPVTMWSQALTDHLCGPTRDSGRLHTAWQECEKCRAWRLFSSLHTSFFAHHSATWLDLQNLDSGNEILRAPTLCSYLSYSVWLCLLLMEQ